MLFDANTNKALSLLLNIINEHQRAHPDGVHVIAGDFNRANLKTVLPNFYQHVKCATRGENTLDHVYTNIKHAYRAIPLPHLGQSDHLSLLLPPTYTPLRRSRRPITKTITTWPDDALSRLQDCFEQTDWNLFHHQELETHTSTVLDYVKFCIGNVTVDKSIRVFPNQKPWMTTQVCKLLKARDAAFRSGDRALYRAARADLRKGVKKAKLDHRRIIEAHLSSNNTREVWKGIHDITNYRGCQVTADHLSAALAEELNNYFARFEAPNQQNSAAPPPPSIPSCSTPPSSPSPVMPLTVTEDDVRKALLAVNPRKAAGPDGVPGKVLRACAPQLAPILTEIFNLSLAQAVIPSCLKSATIIPVPKKSPISSLNDYRPVALTPVIMKCFERLVLQHINDHLPPDLDPHQFAYRTNRSTEDAIALALHAALSHLEEQQSYVRMLFVDYSSAFNTIIPDILIRKLDTIGLPPLTCAWIKDFLTDRPQAVRLGPHLSPTRTLSTGSPQGCVLSPLLYCLYTYDCSPQHDSNLIVKFADDTTVVGLISKGDEAAYREEVLKLAAWCSDNNLALNTKKTKEIIVDFRRHSTDPAPLYINGERVERVHTFRFLGVVLSNNISWTENITEVIKKAQQRLHFLRVLRKHNLDPSLLTTFYRTSIESLLTYCITVWYGSCTMADRERLQRVVKAAQRIIGSPLPSLSDIYSSRCLGRAGKIIKDSSHPGSGLFDLLPSGRRYRCIRSRTNRLKNSFFPKAITILNSHMHGH
uniref:Reverse transcriptase domain-containing protein n=1 Tax=Oryzias sinensis TaxID=183150 RepID=A0A8C7X192_9TELE